MARDRCPGGSVERPASLPHYVPSVYAAWSAKRAGTPAGWFARYAVADGPDPSGARRR